MQTATISVSPLPQSTTLEKIKNVFQAFSVKNIHIAGNTAYIELNDEGDLETLEIQFDNYEVAELNNAKIDKADFDWNSLNKPKQSYPAKNSTPEFHQNLMTVDLDNLIICQNCDQNILKFMSVEQIRTIFKEFHSVNRIVKRNTDVVIQFTDLAEMQLLDMKFDDFKIPHLGKNATIEKAELSKIRPEDFVEKWSESLKKTKSTGTAQNLRYDQDKPLTGQLKSEQKLKIGSKEQKPSQHVLHEDIIPPFDKKTSMQVNFLNEQSKHGSRQEKKHEPIEEAPTHQELDETTKINIQDLQQELEYDNAENNRKQKELIEQENRKKEKERKKQEDEKKARKQQARRQQQEQQKQETRRKEQQRQQKQRLQQSKAQKQRQSEAQRRRESELMSQQLKQKIYAQRQKHQRATSSPQNNQKHSIPTESQTVAQETEAIRQVGQTIEKQLGYAVNKAKEESINLLNTGLELLKGKTLETGQKLEEVKSSNQNLGYEKWSVKPDVSLPSGVSAGRPSVLKTLITISLLIWVIFLLMQDTSGEISTNQTQISAPNL